LLAGALRPVQKSIKVIAGSSFRAAPSSSSASNSSFRQPPNGEFVQSINNDITRKRARSDSVSSDNGRSSSSSSSSSSSVSVDRPRVLVCAPSNTAVDELVFRILTQGIYDQDGLKAEDLNVVRVGHSSLKDEMFSSSSSSSFFGNGKRKYQSFQPSSAAVSASSSSSAYLNHTSLASMNETEYNIMRIVEKVSLESIVEDRRKALLASDGKKNLGISFKYSDIRKQILEKADIVCCTLSGAGSQPLLEVILRITGYKFDAVIIDEAAQAVEPSSLIPFKYNPQLVILVGDPCKLSFDFLLLLSSFLALSPLFSFYLLLRSVASNNLLSNC
jgi:superfamily I DNA and/or RNA helicase